MKEDARRRVEPPGIKVGEKEKQQHKKLMNKIKESFAAHS